MTFYEELFDALPPHIKDDKDFSKLVKLFFDVIEERFELSNDTLQAKMVDSLYQKFQSNREIRYSDRREQLLRLHLNELFQAIEDTYKNEAFFKRLTRDFQKLGIEPSDFQIEEKFLKTLEQAHINSNKSFNENKGKLISFVYAYHIVSQANLQGFNSGNGFIKVIENIHPSTKEPIPFSYKVESSLYQETFDSMVKPLVHPIGFGYAFTTLLEFMFEDYFLVKEIKHLEELFIRCLQPDGTYIETDMMEHEILGFNEIQSDLGIEFWAKYKDKDTGELKKLFVSYDNVVRIYSLENLRIKSLRLFDPLQGILNETRGADGSIVSVDYHQYFINRKHTLRLFFTLEDDLSNNEYEAIIQYNPDDYSVVPGETYLQPLKISAADILDSVYGDLHGRLIEELPRTCGIHYKIRIERISQVQEELWFKLRMGFLDYFARNPLIQASPNTTYYVGKAVDPNRNPSEWIPLIGDFYISDTRPHESSTTKYFIGRAYDSSKAPSEWEPLIGEADFYLSASDISAVDQTFNFWNYPIELPLVKVPEFELLGKDEEFWLKQYPRYDDVINANEVASSSYEAFDSHAVAWDVIHSEIDIKLLKHDKRGVLTAIPWRIGDQIIGEKYTDAEIADFLNGTTKLPDGESILTIGALYDGFVADGDLYPTREIDDNLLEVEIKTQNVFEDIVPSDEIFDISYEQSLEDYMYKTVIGNHLIIDGSWTIDQDFDILTIENKFDVSKEDIDLEKVSLNVGAFTIGNDYTDEQIELARQGRFTLTKDPVYISFKYLKNILSGDRFPITDIHEEFEIQEIRA